MFFNDCLNDAKLLASTHESLISQGKQDV